MDDNPKHPWKAVAAAAAAACTAGMAYATDMPKGLVIVLAMVGAFALTFTVRNPKI